MLSPGSGHEADNGEGAREDRGAGLSVFCEAAASSNMARRWPTKEFLRVEVGGLFGGVGLISVVRLCRGETDCLLGVWGTYTSGICRWISSRSWSACCRRACSLDEAEKSSLTASLGGCTCLVVVLGDTAGGGEAIG